MGMKVFIFIVVVSIGAYFYMESTIENTKDNFNISQASNDGYDGYPNKKIVKIELPKMTSNKKNFIEKLNTLIPPHSKTKLFISVVIGQAIQESWMSNRDTVSGLAKNNSNLFGIKLRSGSNYKDSPYSTKEYNSKSKKFETVISSFQKYSNWNQSIADHYDTLKLYRYRRVFSAKNYKEQIISIHKGGWATDPNYSKSIINIIEQNKLYLYDK